MDKTKNGSHQNDEKFINLTSNLLNAFTSMSELVSDFGIINKEIVSLTQMERMGIDEFSCRTLNLIPCKLYKYYPNKKDINTQINHSIESLKCNTVYLQSPTLFDDVYDSNISTDWITYVNIRLNCYLIQCGAVPSNINSTIEMSHQLSTLFYESWNKSQSINDLFCSSYTDESEELRVKLFISRVESYVKQNKCNSWEEAISNSLNDEYDDYVKFVRNMFRISCFTTTPYQQLMWGGEYADRHKGFCVEYAIERNSAMYRELLLKLFPVLYCKERPDITEFMIQNMDNFSDEKHWYVLFHGFLRKSIDWLYQDEWRLLRVFSKDENNYSVPFFPISKVYIGCRMGVANRKEIIELCKSKDIPYIGVRPDKVTFTMQDCPDSCEKCSHFLGGIENNG